MPPSAYKWEYGKLYSYDPTSEEYNKHTCTVFMLHGLGDTGQGWSFAGEQLKIDGAKWLFPTAPTRPISCNMGMSMPGWFDVKQLPLSAPIANEQVSRAEMNEKVDESDIKDSVKYLLDLVQVEIKEKGIPPEKIILGGFSQGGHIAARAALECEEPIAGCVVLSSWIGEVEGLESRSSKVPFFIGHGQADPMVPVSFGEKSHSYIKGLGNPVTFRTYPGVEHSCNLQELDDVKDFICGCLEDPITVEDLAGMSAGKLKKWLLGKGADTTGCLEKQDLIEKAKEILKE